mmetsp:Transcript_10629/g.27021  ORF Transcript_10629/g.27021 Transcript_10629/m.27021 type:complete len:214 (-) Transcript_10629:1628-2269(-)
MVRYLQGGVTKVGDSPSQRHPGIQLPEHQLLVLARPSQAGWRLRCAEGSQAGRGLPVRVHTKGLRAAAPAAPDQRVGAALCVDNLLLCLRVFHHDEAHCAAAHLHAEQRLHAHLQRLLLPGHLQRIHDRDAGRGAHHKVRRAVESGARDGARLSLRERHAGEWLPQPAQPIQRHGVVAPGSHCRQAPAAWQRYQSQCRHLLGVFLPLGSQYLS